MPLPPLFAYKSALTGSYFVRSEGMTEAQAAEVIRIVEVAYPALVAEAAIASSDPYGHDAAQANASAVLYQAHETHTLRPSQVKP